MLSCVVSGEVSGAFRFAGRLVDDPEQRPRQFSALDRGTDTHVELLVDEVIRFSSHRLLQRHFGHGAIPELAEDLSTLDRRLHTRSTLGIHPKTL